VIRVRVDADCHSQCRFETHAVDRFRDLLIAAAEHGQDRARHASQRHRWIETDEEAHPPASHDHQALIDEAFGEGRQVAWRGRLRHRRGRQLRCHERPTELSQRVDRRIIGDCRHECGVVAEDLVDCGLSRACGSGE
jgi:hypothetical protein